MAKGKHQQRLETIEDKVANDPEVQRRENVWPVPFSGMTNGCGAKSCRYT